MRRRRALMVVGFTLAVAGCHSGHQAGSDATVTGVVRGYGGPLIMNHGKPHMAVDGRPETGQPITARAGDGSTTTATTGGSGRYILRIPAGRYVIKAGCSTGVTVTVHSGQQLSVPLRCDFP